MKTPVTILIVALGAMTCAHAADDAEVKALEAKCEAAREAKIRPLRDAEIARCKSEKRTDPAYCERFYSDLGNAVRNANGTMSPRMFDDLPECVAALKARQGVVK